MALPRENSFNLEDEGFVQTIKGGPVLQQVVRFNEGHPWIIEPAFKHPQNTIQISLLYAKSL